jgi:hypothetical protein
MAIQRVRARLPGRFSRVYGKVLAFSNRVPMVEPKSRNRIRPHHACVNTVDVALYACVDILKEGFQESRSHAAPPVSAAACGIRLIMASSPMPLVGVVGRLVLAQAVRDQALLKLYEPRGQDDESPFVCR